MEGKQWKAAWHTEGKQWEPLWHTEGKQRKATWHTEGKQWEPVWHTIPAFSNIRTQNPYHKEQESGRMDVDAPKNLHVLARSTIKMEKKRAGKYLLNITADDYYKLYVNGNFAGQGPAPAYPEQYYYNTIDITPWLREGKNVLAVHLYYQGLVNRVWNSGDGRFAMAAELWEEPESPQPAKAELRKEPELSQAVKAELRKEPESPQPAKAKLHKEPELSQAAKAELSKEAECSQAAKAKLRKEPELSQAAKAELSKEEERPQAAKENGRIPLSLSWKCQVCRAYSGEATGYDTQYLENFDSRLWEENWMEPGYQDSHWMEMEPAMWADYRLVPQPVEMVSVYEQKPKVIEKTGENTWFLDAGCEVAGGLILTARGNAGQKVILAYGEELSEGEGTGREEAEKAEGEAGRGEAGRTEENMQRTEGAAFTKGRPKSVRWQMRCNCAYREEWTLKDGISHYIPYDYKGFRYAQLETEPGVEILDIRLQIRHYPVKREMCQFETSAPYLKGMFNICRQAVIMGTQEGYLDCPTREKGQYLGDAVVTSRSQIWLTGKTDMLRKCISQFAQTEKICPGLMGVAPGSLMQEIADFSLLWPQLLLTDYQFTGDREFLQQYYPTVKNMIGYFERYKREDGLLDCVSEKWNLVDWPENLRDNYEFPLTRPVAAKGCHNVINALYVGAMKTLSELEQILELPETQDWQKQRDAFIRVFYREGRRLFADSEHGSHCALHSNLYPLYFDFVPEEGKEAVAHFLVEKGLECGTMTSFYLLKALAKAGFHQEMYQLMVNTGSHGWVNMLREGASACFEVWGKDQKWNTSLCHPWSSAPISLLIEETAGIHLKPQCPKGYEWIPHIPEEIEEFEIKVPFRDRSISVKKKKGTVSIEDNEYPI